MRSLVLGACLMTVGPALGQPGPEKVFLEVPMLLEAPQHQKMIRAWHDGERFYVDAVMLLSELGFAVTSENATVTALDIDSKIVIDFARRQQVLPQQRSLHKEVLHSDGRFLLSMAALRRVFGSDIHFDTDRLHLRISTSAQLFDASSMHMRRPVWNEAPGPLIFKRHRAWWGGVMLNWQIHRQPGFLQAGVQVMGSVLRGTLQGHLGTGRQALTYFYDRPQGRDLTRVEFGRFADGFSGVRFSNRPLVTRQLQRIHVIKGRTSPHGLVEARISGHLVDQVQADADGTVSAPHPAMVRDQCGGNPHSAAWRPAGSL